LDFCAWMRGLGLDDDTLKWYCRYAGKLPVDESGILEVGKVECNSWMLKLTRHYLDYLLDGRIIGIEEYARLGLELQAREKVCRKRLEARGRGAYKCPDKPRVPDRRTRHYAIARALAESGVRLKELHRVARAGLEGEVVEEAGTPLIVIDVLERRGFKRVNIVSMTLQTWLRARRALQQLDYKSIVDYYSKRRLTPVSCYRKYHWNTCLALGTRQLCEFIQGRSKPVSITHYERYKWTAARLQARVVPAMSIVLEEGLSALNRLEYEDSPLHVDHYLDPVPRPYPQGTGEPGGNGHPEAHALPRLIRKYLDLL